MKKVFFLSFAVFLFSFEVQFGGQVGVGSFNIKGGIFGLRASHSTKIKALSFVNEHGNIFGSDFFFAYKVSFYQSKTLNSLIYNYNSTINGVNIPDTLNKSIPVIDDIPIDSNNNLTSSSDTVHTSPQMDSIPATNTIPNISANTFSETLNKIKQAAKIDYKITGIDINIALGYDFLKNKKGDYLGFGILTGVSFPYIKSKSSDDSNDISLGELDYLKNSKTKMITYKLGGTIRGYKSLTGFLGIYGDTNYAFQTARVKNTSAHINVKSHGVYYSYNLGIKLQAKKKIKIWKLSLSPSLFTTFGFRKEFWRVNDVKVGSLNILPSKIYMSLSQVYFGIGYTF